MNIDYSKIKLEPNDVLICKYNINSLNFDIEQLKQMFDNLTKFFKDNKVVFIPNEFEFVTKANEELIDLTKVNLD